MFLNQDFRKASAEKGDNLLHLFPPSVGKYSFLQSFWEPGKPVFSVGFSAFSPCNPNSPKVLWSVLSSCCWLPSTQTTLNKCLRYEQTQNVFLMAVKRSGNLPIEFFFHSSACPFWSALTPFWLLLEQGFGKGSMHLKEVTLFVQVFVSQSGGFF